MKLSNWDGWSNKSAPISCGHMVKLDHRSSVLTVVNRFSNLMVEVFGQELGVGARSAVGMATLPMNTPVEVEAVFQISD